MACGAFASARGSALSADSTPLTNPMRRWVVSKIKEQGAMPHHKQITTA
jgi:hypothetical protein